MSIVPDMSDAGLVRQFGDIMHEMPELYEALRRFEMQNRPMSMSGGLKMRADWVSVSVCSGRGVTRIRVGNSGRME
jgi:hypothetical protein